MKTNGFVPRVLTFLAGVLLVLGASAEETVTPITHKELLGRWRGGDTNDLNCILVFENKGAKIYTFRREKHLSTVNSWYRVFPGQGKVTLGINGEAVALPGGKLQLKLSREFNHIVVLREATLDRMPEQQRD